MRSHLVGILENQLLKVYEANSYGSAIDILENRDDIMMVISDYDMQDGDGLTLIKKVRQNYSKEIVSILVISNNLKSEVATKILKRGANDFIHKGFSPQEFAARVNMNLDMLDLFKTNVDRANKDYLTKLNNRRHFFELAKPLYKNAKKRLFKYYSSHDRYRLF
jgi:PleD family two-component response regulator